MTIQSAKQTVFPLSKWEAEAMFRLFAMGDTESKRDRRAADTDVAGGVSCIKQTFCKAIHHLFIWKSDGDIHTQISGVCIFTGTKSCQSPVEPMDAK